jgi:hypothetical protein
MGWRWAAILWAAGVCVACTPGAPAFNPSPHALWTDAETGMGFAVIPINPHPFLVDHERQLVIVPPRGYPVRVALYPDPGGGMLANLYKDDRGQFVIIDNNGIWLSIDPVNGSVLDCRWRWEEPTPKGYLGTFERDKSVVYRFIPAAERPEPPIYGFKDPTHPLLRE